LNESQAEMSASYHDCMEQIDAQRDAAQRKLDRWTGAVEQWSLGRNSTRLWAGLEWVKSL